MVTDLDAKFERWRKIVEDNHAPFGHFLANADRPWTVLGRPLAESRVALVTSGGVHVADDPPFNLEDPEGDTTFRMIPSSSRSSDLRVSHSHYDTEPARRDINCLFPIDRIRELAEEGVIGEVAPRYVGMMGFIPDGRRVAAELAPAVASALANDSVDVAILSPG